MTVALQLLVVNGSFVVAGFWLASWWDRRRR